jgi:hypothetical protein
VNLYYRGLAKWQGRIHAVQLELKQLTDYSRDRTLWIPLVIMAYALGFISCFMRQTLTHDLLIEFELTTAAIKTASDKDKIRHFITSCVHS